MKKRMIGLFALFAVTVLCVLMNLPVRVFAAEQQEIAGRTLASELPEGAALELTGETTLMMDRDLEIERIQGNFPLMIQGDHVLTVSASDGSCISAYSVQIEADLHLTAAKHAVYAYDSVSINHCTVFAETQRAQDGYCIYAGNGFTLEEGVLNVRSSGGGICAEDGTVSITGDLDVKAEGAACAALNGDLKIHRGTITMEGGDPSNSYHFGAIYAGKSITVEDGEIHARGIASQKSSGLCAWNGDIVLKGNVEAKGGRAVFAPSGSVSVQGLLDLESDSGSGNYGIYAGENVTLLAGAIRSSAGSGGVFAEVGNITINGDFTSDAVSHPCTAIQGNVEIQGGTVTIHGGGVADSYQFGAIYAGKNVSVAGGTVQAEARSETKGSGITAWSGDILLGGTVTADGAKAIYAPQGSVEVTGSLRTTAPAATGSYGLYAGSGVALRGGSIHAESAYAGVYTESGNVDLSGDFYSKARVNPCTAMNGSILVRDGTVRVYGGGSSDVYRFGALYAHSDVVIQSGTVELEGGSFEKNTGVTAWTGQITLGGAVSVKASRAVYAPQGSVLITGCLTSEATDQTGSYHVFAGKQITIDGGVLDAHSGYAGIFTETGDITINGDCRIQSLTNPCRAMLGSLTIDGGSVSFAAEQGTDDGAAIRTAGGIHLRGGTVTAVVSQNASGCGVYSEQGDIELSAPLIAEGTPSIRAAQGSIVMDEEYGVLEPFGGAVQNGDDSTICDAQGTPATKIRIGVPEYYRVRFDLNGHGAPCPADQMILVGSGAAPAKPADPQEDGMEFTGWFTEAACWTPYDFNTPVSSDLVLYAGWREQKPEMPFVDVAEKQYYFEPVLWAVNHQPIITAGTSASTFSPNHVCTRAQVVTFLWRAHGCPEPGIDQCPFTDVKKTDYFYKAVLWAVEQKITAGTSAVSFSPAVGCTRAQVVTFLWRSKGSPANDGAEYDTPFTDIKPSDYYYEAVIWAVGHRITAGTTSQHFSPKNICTRAQIVTFLYRDELQS